MSLLDRQYNYDVISLDLGTARSDLAQGLTKKINTLTVLTLNAGSLSVKLNTASDKSITLSDNLKIDGVPIIDLYWTNILQAGKTAKIFIAWID